MATVQPTVQASRIRRFWNSFYEPKFVTITMIFMYLVSALSGYYLIEYALTDHGELYEPLALLTGTVLIVTGLLGAVVAWTGKYWLERGIALAFSGGGFLVFVTLGLAYYIHHTIPFYGPDAEFAMARMVLPILFGINRFERCRLTPFAAGKGPMLAEHRTILAVQKMNDDWEQATSAKGE